MLRRQFRPQRAPTSQVDWRRGGVPTARPTQRPGFGAAVRPGTLLRDRLAAMRGGATTRGGGTGRPVPGLPGVVFGGGTGSRANIPNAVAFGKSMTGGVAGDAISRIQGDVAGRLAQSGITRDADGTYRITGSPSGVGGTGAGIPGLSGLAQQIQGAMQRNIRYPTPIPTAGDGRISMPGGGSTVPGVSGAVPVPPATAGPSAATPTVPPSAPAQPPAAAPATGPLTQVAPADAQTTMPGAQGGGLTSAGTPPAGTSGGQAAPASLPTPAIPPGGLSTAPSSAPVPVSPREGDQGIPATPSFPRVLGAGAALDVTTPFGPGMPIPPTDAMRAAVLPNNRTSGIWPTAGPGDPLQPTLEEAQEQQAAGEIYPGQSSSALMSAPPPQAYQEPQTASPLMSTTPELTQVAPAESSTTIPGAQGGGLTSAGTPPGGGPPPAAPPPVAAGPGGTPIPPAATEPAPAPAPPPAATEPAPAPAPAPAPSPAVPVPNPPPGTPGQTPPAPGRPTIPQATPGAVPGARVSFPAGFPFNDRPGAPGDLANLGTSISEIVRSRQGRRPGITPLTPGSPAVSGLEGLGDRIRAAIGRGTGEIGVGRSGAGELGEGAGSIMDLVKTQLSGRPGTASPKGLSAGGLARPGSVSGFPAATPRGAANLPPGAITDPGFAAPPRPAPTPQQPGLPSTMPMPTTQPSGDTGFGPPAAAPPRSAAPPPALTQVAPTGATTTMPGPQGGGLTTAGTPQPMTTDWKQEAATGTASPLMMASPTGGTLGAVTGPVKAPLQMPNATGATWEMVNEWDDEILAATAKYPEVDPAMVKSAMLMESLGDPNAQNGPAQGVMQIQTGYHYQAARDMGIPLSHDPETPGTPANDIEYWTALMAGKVPNSGVTGATPLDRYISNYQQPPGYRADVESLMGEINAAAPAPGDQPAPIPTSGLAVNTDLTAATDAIMRGKHGMLDPAQSGTPPLTTVGGLGQPAPVPPGAEPAAAPAAAPTGPVQTAGNPVYNGIVYEPGSIASGAAQPITNDSLEGSLAEQGGMLDPNPIAGYDPKFIVYHITSGEGDPSTAGSAIYAPGGATNFMIGRDGQIWKFVEPGSGIPLANGADVVAVDKTAVQEHLAAGGEMNRDSISIEVVASRGSELTPEQIAAGQYLTASLSETYGIPMDEQHVIGHSDVDQLNKGDGDANTRGSGDWDPYSVYDPAVMIPTTGNPSLPRGTTPAPLPGELPPTDIPGGNGVYNTVAEPSGELAPNGEAMSITGPQSTGWAKELVAGGQESVLAGTYGFGIHTGSDDYGNYGSTWPCSDCHTGTDIGAPLGTPFTSLVGGTVVCVNGGGSAGGGQIGCLGSADDGGGVGQLSVQTDNGAVITYGHTSTVPEGVGLGAPITPGMTIGTVGSGNGVPHIHQEIQLPIGPPDTNGNPTYLLVDPNMYYAGEYCDRGFCPTQSGQPAAPQQQGAGMLASATMSAPAPAPSGGNGYAPAPTYQTQAPVNAQTTMPAPAPAGGLLGAAAPPPTTYGTAPQHVAPTSTGQTGQVVTDSAGRQYEVMADGSQRLIYDPAW